MTITRGSRTSAKTLRQDNFWKAGFGYVATMTIWAVVCGQPSLEDHSSCHESAGGTGADDRTR